METRIKEIRKASGLTQTQFGKRIGLKGNTITNYETGLRIPSEAAILSICREFNVNRAWLESGEGEMFASRDPDATIDKIVERYNESDVFRSILEVYARLTPAEQKMFDDFVLHVSERLNDSAQDADMELYDKIDEVIKKARPDGQAEEA